MDSRHSHAAKCRVGLQNYFDDFQQKCVRTWAVGFAFEVAKQGFYGSMQDNIRQSVSQRKFLAIWILRLTNAATVIRITSFLPITFGATGTILIFSTCLFCRCSSDIFLFPLFFPFLLFSSLFFFSEFFVNFRTRFTCVFVYFYCLVQMLS